MSIKDHNKVFEEKVLEIPKPTLPPEIWSAIITLLLRPSPTARSECKKSDLHQQDLASCMQVSKMFFDLTSPILYREPIVFDIYSFFCSMLNPFPQCHVSSPNYVQPVATSTRLSTLSQVKNIHLILDSIPSGPLYSTMLIVPGSFKYPFAPEEYSEGLMATDVLFHITNAATELHHNKTNYMPNLQTLTTNSFTLENSPEFLLANVKCNHNHAGNCEHRDPIIIKDMENGINRCSSSTTHWLSSLAPEFRCMKGWSGAWCGIETRLFRGHQGRRGIDMPRKTPKTYTHSASVIFGPKYMPAVPQIELGVIHLLGGVNSEF